jgi:predicted transcriptional regulator
LNVCDRPNLPLRAYAAFQLSIKAARLLFQIAPIRLKSVQNGWEDRSQMQISNSVERTPIELVGDIVSAYAAHNSVQRSELIGLIGSVHAVLAKLASQSSTSGEVEPEPQTPAVPIRKPITPEYLICLDDGRRLKTLKRHLNELGMTPEQYRKKWNLPDTYPMVAPNYSDQRSKLAKQMGLGQVPRKRKPAS